MVEPFKELTVNFDSKIVMLDNPLEMADPKKAFTENPWTTCKVSLVYKGASTMFGGERDHAEPEGEEFAKGHYEQLVTATGSIAVGDQEWSVDGCGLRDHSWGRAHGRRPGITAGSPPTSGRTSGSWRHASLGRTRRGRRAGFLWDGEMLRFVNDVRISTSWEGEESYHRGIEATLTSGDDVWKVTGRVMNLIPLRNRRNGLVTRISEGMTEWTLSDGRVGYGLSEYLDQIIDGAPVGIAE